MINISTEVSSLTAAQIEGMIVALKSVMVPACVTFTFPCDGGTRTLKVTQQAGETDEDWAKRAKTELTEAMKDC